MTYIQSLHVLTEEKELDLCSFSLLIYQVITFTFHVFKGGRDGEVVRALASHQCGLGSIPAQCHMWVEFVVGSHLAPRVFLGVLRFSFLHKNQHSELIRPENTHEKQLRLMWLW